MKLLITGGCGFLGSNLAANSMKLGYELVVFDNLYRTGSQENLRWLQTLTEFRFFHGDIRNTNDVTRVICEFKPQAVFHLAGQVDITLQYDQLALDYLRGHPACRYLFLSSGAAYGSTFDEPIGRTSKAVITLNDLPSQEWYGVAKVHAECRHRSLSDMAIIDIRVFNYFSRTQDLSARFLLTDIVRNIRDGTILQTTPDYIVRDFLHPADFCNLIHSLLSSPPANAAVDCYTRAPIDKPGLLTEMQRQLGLRYEVSQAPIAVNATGTKPYYYSLNKRAADFGYVPTRTSIQGILEEARAILS